MLGVIYILNKIIYVLKDKKAMSETISMMLFTLVFAIMGMLGLTAAGYIHNVTVLDRFADEMVACATLSTAPIH